MAEMGAEIIKIELAPNGDASRGIPIVKKPGRSGYFIQQNRGKKSLCLDLKKEGANQIVEDLIKKVPLLNLIYSSVKDLMNSFMGDEKKFNEPVLVKFESNIYKPGFVTSEDLKEINLPGMVSVYLPHSYNFSGNVFITDKKNIKPLKNTSADVMKYIVSGGISGKIKA